MRIVNLKATFTIVCPERRFREIHTDLVDAAIRCMHLRQGGEGERYQILEDGYAVTSREVFAAALDELNWRIRSYNANVEASVLGLGHDISTGYFVTVSGTIYASGSTTYDLLRMVEKVREYIAKCPNMER